MKNGNAVRGKNGEREIIRLAPCPGCGHALEAKRINRPLYDLECPWCCLRFQVKSPGTRPRNTVGGAGWDVMRWGLKQGQAVTPLIVNFKWTDKGKPRQEICFWPLIPTSHLSHYRLSATARRANYRMFTYSRLLELPHFVLRASKWVLPSAVEEAT